MDGNKSFWMLFCAQERIADIFEGTQSNLYVNHNNDSKLI